MSQIPQPDTWDAIEKAMFVLMGWLLALLTSPIVDAIRRRRELKQARLGVISELAELKYRMAIVTYYIEGKYGDRSHDFLRWVKPFIAGYTGPMPAENVVKAIDAQLALTPEKLRAYVESQTDSGRGLSLKKYPVPFFASKLDSVAWLPENVRRLILEINTQLDILDAEAENTQYYFRLTFNEGLTGGNRDRVQGNLEEGYRNYARIAKIIIERISQLEAVWA